jgi:hypothetical protein
MRARTNQSLVARKIPVAYCARDSHELLINHTTCANILVPDLAIAHHRLAVFDWESDIFARCLDQSVWPLTL